MARAMLPHERMTSLTKRGWFQTRNGPGGTQASRVLERFAPLYLVLAIVAVLVVLVAGLPSERRAISALSEEQRLAAVSRGVDELKQLCGERRTNALREHCREVASFVAQFDECRGECEALARSQLTPTPSR
jgi:hypothetical protein